MNWKIKDAVVPSKLENILYLIIGIAVTLAGNFSFFAERLAGESLYISENIRQAVDLYIQQFWSFFDSMAIAPASAVFIFWSIAGIISFSILQAAIGVGSEVKADFDITTHYLHPRHYARISFLIEVVVQGLTRTAIYTVGVIAAMMVGSVLAPVAISLLQSLLVGFTIELLFIYLGSLILLWFGILMVATCVRLFLLRKHVEV